MSRYLRRVGLFVLLQASILAILIVLLTPATYQSEIAAKSHLLATAPPPRVILVGGSNLSMGIDSPLLQEALGGRYTPVNMGLNAGLGLEFELNQALDGVRPGDVVVVSPEYETLWIPKMEYPSLWLTLIAQPSAWAHVPADRRIGALASFVSDNEPLAVAHFYATDGSYFLLGGGQGPYVKGGFNEFGDLTTAWNLPSQYVNAPVKVVGEPWLSVGLSESADTLRRFVSQCNAKGASVVYSYPPWAEGLFQMNQASVERTAQVLESKLPISFLNDPNSLAPGNFYNTPYHLRGEAVQARTRDLALGLRSYLGLET